MLKRILVVDSTDRASCEDFLTADAVVVSGEAGDPPFEVVKSRWGSRAQHPTLEDALADAVADKPDPEPGHQFFETTAPAPDYQYEKRADMVFDNVTVGGSDRKATGERKHDACETAASCWARTRDELEQTIEAQKTMLVSQAINHSKETATVIARSAELATRADLAEAAYEKLRRAVAPASSSAVAVDDIARIAREHRIALDEYCTAFRGMERQDIINRIRERLRKELGHVG